ncbi:hypothetical protein A3K78_00425 [Candidatus Bathyarchaeota archaeon RBG_13_52_12]|nr:MAG: hypothetical protein A3K78_00425 [Candidatus Bathyarchaeota archaeon RBG_13_52_12]
MLFGALTPATFVARPNRFLGLAEVDGATVECFIPNPGRMRELLFRGARVYLHRCDHSSRKTSYDLTLTEHEGTLVSIDSRVPNSVIDESIRAELLPEFDGYVIDRHEPIFGDSRFDLRLIDGSRSALLEIKSCTLVVSGIALFPDAPTRRGARHLRTLSEALRVGRSAFVFLIQRDDACSLRPNEATDPDFSDALRKALLKGVEVYAYGSKVTLEGITINRRVPVKI